MINRVFLSVLVLLFFVGCSIKEMEKPIKEFTVDTPKMKVLSLDKKSLKVLKIERFKSPAYLDSKRIWYKKEGNQIGSYVYASWSENFPALLVENLSNVLFSTHIFKSLFIKYSKIVPDFILEGEITDSLQIVTKDGAYVRFGVRLYFIDKASSTLLDSKEFKYIQKCDSIDSKGAIEAYNKIVKKLDKEVILWLKTLVKEN